MDGRGRLRCFDFHISGAALRDGSRSIGVTGYGRSSAANELARHCVAFCHDTLYECVYLLLRCYALYLLIILHSELSCDMCDLLLPIYAKADPLPSCDIGKYKVLPVVLRTCLGN